MAGRVFNIQQGRSKVVEFTGLKEMQQRVNQLKTRATSQACLNIMAESATLLHDQAAANLKSVNAPHEVESDLFVYARQKSSLVSAEQEVTALTGLKKKGTSAPAKGYVEWFANSQRGRFEKTSRTNTRRPKLNLGGVKIGENLGTMWELGTSKMAPKPWWRPAVQAVRGAMFTSMASGLRRLIGGDAP